MRQRPTAGAALIYGGSEVLFGVKQLVRAKVNGLTSLRDFIDKPIAYQFLN